MPRCRFARAHRHAAYLALLAMLLLMAGPVIGQLSAFDESGHAHHASASMPAMAQVPIESSSGSHHVSKAVSWHEQCGYCSLLHHCPFLAAALPPAGQELTLATAKVAAATRSAYGHPSVFPHALTRAPPVASR